MLFTKTYGRVLAPARALWILAYHQSWWTEVISAVRGIASTNALEAFTQQQLIAGGKT